MKTKTVNSKLKEYPRLRELYENTFPKNERLPMRILLLFKNRKGIDFTAFYDEDVFIGFTYVMTFKRTTFLMYLATDTEQRSKGYGSQIVNWISEKYKENTIVLNIQAADINSENYPQRLQRQTFYFKNKFIDSGYIVKEEANSYDILYRGNSFSKDKYEKIFGRFSFGLMKVKAVKK